MDINTLNIDASAKANALAWLEGEYDEATKQAIRDMAEQNPNELNESFYRNLEFGTGGLRGIMGVGTNRMNKYTVAMATQGLANYVKKVNAGEKELRAAVSHDSRNHSREFAEITASVLAANGYKVYLFDGMRPTPELSFAVRHFYCHTGVMVTASHNPKEYNGYKAYWSDGCQLTAPHDEAVIEEVLKIKGLSDVKIFGQSENQNIPVSENPNITIIGEDVDSVYLDRVEANALNPEVIKKHHDVKIVYTPLHGTGITLIPRMLKKLGFTNVNVVEAQAVPDGNFPTTPSPNPEEKAAMKMAVDLAKETDADIVFASDPDADRVGVAVKRPDGEWMLLNGNQTMSVLFYYIVRQWQEKQLLTGNEFMVKTIVTSELPADIANRAGIKVYDVLTGFKFIGAKILELEGIEKFIAGGEESYGYMIGDFVRDKDAVAACSMIAEIAAWAIEQGKTFFDVLVDLYREYGFYKEGLVSVVRKGKSGAEEIQQMMRDYRSNPPAEIDGEKVVCIKDYKLHESKDLITGKVTPIDLPTSNVLQFFTDKGNKITVRPSGTEPKIKFYFGVKGELCCKECFDKANDELDAKIESIKRSMNLV
ncbi:MAG: phospho-sugar mutase [Bacteroidales bacterium]|nr:phospho-sugar mutase [Bacteroidales bacterium]